MSELRCKHSPLGSCYFTIVITIIIIVIIVIIVIYFSTSLFAWCDPCVCEVSG